MVDQKRDQFGICRPYKQLASPVAPYTCEVVFSKMSGINEGARGNQHELGLEKTSFSIRTSAGHLSSFVKRTFKSSAPMCRESFHATGLPEKPILSQAV